ncbi:MAG TPA: hypothetical protein DDW27_12005 [Bacteroidales bacterium]|nr:hypothetical protein [Bacteroidales bacterium]
MDKVLIITYYWPPSGGAGVQRWLKFSKYLPDFGLEPVILTVDPQYASYPQQDRGLLEEISPSLEIIKTKSSTGIFSAYKILTGRSEIPYGGFANEDDPGFLRKFSRFIRGNFVLPDARKGWNRYAFRAAQQIISDEKIEKVITTSPPHSTQLTGLKLKKELNIKWIADLRDPWTEIYYSSRMYQTIPARKINRVMEVNVLNSADRVITTCNATRDLFRSKLDSDQSPGKIITVTNGFDPADFKYGEIRPVDFTITYLGTFAGNYNANVLAEALDYCEARNIGEIKLNFIGKTDSTVERLFKDHRNVILNIVPYVEHTRAMEYLARSAALLLVVPSESKHDEMIPGKLFEYLASKRKIIGLGPKESDVADILEKTKGGKMFTKNDSGELGEYLISLKADLNNGIYESAPEGLEEYTRKTLAGKIAGILNSV